MIPIVLALCAIANADPAPTRVVLADPDPALRRALLQSLKPWRIEVVVESDTPHDDNTAAMRAGDRNARYVVWREGAELVVFDRETNHAERRVAPAGTLDALGAAAAALSVKTMLRLPDTPEPETTTTVIVPPVVPPPLIGPTTELRFDAGIGGRAEYGLDSNIALRFLTRAAARPWLDRTLRFGIAGDFGADATVDQAGFHGRWTNWALVATASFAIELEGYEIAPWLGFGIEHSALDGSEMGMTRHEEDVLPAYRVGVGIRRSVLGAELLIEGLAKTHTYTKLDGPAQVFEIPPISALLSVFVTADVGL